jgi:hypothetical protein
VTSKGAANVQRGDVPRPNADHQEKYQRLAVVAVPEHRQQAERIGNIDQAKEAERGIGQHPVERPTEAGPGQQQQRQRAEHGQFSLEVEAGQGEGEHHRRSRSHPPTGSPAASGIGQRHVFECRQFGDKARNRGQHPKLSQEDEGNNAENQQDGGEDTFHWASSRIHAGALKDRLCFGPGRLADRGYRKVVSGRE